MLASEIAGVHRGSHFHSDLPECHFDETDLRKLPLHTNERLRAMGKKMDIAFTFILHLVKGYS